MFPRPPTALLIGFLLLHLFPAAAASEQDPFAPLRPLVGLWTGAGSGFGNESSVSHQWDLALQGIFLRLQTVSTDRSPAESGEIHEDLGLLSYDTDTSGFVFRQYLSEGYVNTFDVTIETAEPPTIHFAARESESGGGLRVQMRLVFLSATEYRMELDLAAPGKDFSTCQRMQMKKVH